jgi:hypothetical protein
MQENGAVALGVENILPKISDKEILMNDDINLDK